MPPVAKKITKELTIHGDTRVDPYFWLNQRENPEVISYLTAENDFLKEGMKRTETFQEELYQEMRSRIKEDDNSVPYLKNGYYYYTRFETESEYPFYCRKKESLEADEEVMVNVNNLAEGHEYCAVGGLKVSPNNLLALYAEDTIGRRIYSLKFKNLETGEMLEDELASVTGNAVWAADNKTIFYSKQDSQTLRSFQIYRHELGTSPDEDKLIYEEKDETFTCYVTKTKSEQYILIASNSTLTDEYHYLPANEPTSDFKVIHPRERGIEYSVNHAGDKFYIRTNWQAENFRLMSALPGKTTKEHWEEVIPHRKDVLLEGTSLFKDFLVLDERKGGLTHLRIIRWDGQMDTYLPFEEAAYMAYTSGNPEYDSQKLRYGYQSMTTPTSTYEYDMVTGEKVLLKEREVLGGFDRKDYKTDRIFATADDGTKVPISLVYHKNTPLDGTSPTLLYGYGSYGNSLDPYFSTARLSLLNKGFVYAVAHIRGGEEMGRYWYEEGKLLNKKNTFTDFIACGEHMIAQKYAAPDQLYAMGGSAGGLLMGAVVNMRPELWAGVVASVPFVDVITTMLDESIPLTTGEYDEWGNPNDPEYYTYIKSYSPYDQVEAKAYPPMLVTTGLHDSQVQYWEPAKWVAKLRDLKTDDNPLYLHTNMDAGHGGASGRFRALKEVAMEYSFFLDLAGKI